MENLNREAILRMLSGKTGNSSSGVGGGDIDLAGYATMIWVTENFVSIDFFRELFRAYDSNSNEILPNDTTSTIDNIKAMVGTWTEQYLTALGNQSGGGGGGGGASYLNDLLDVQLTTPLTDGQALVYNATLQKWVNGAAGVNMTTVWNALAGSTNEQINTSHLSTALSGYVTTSAISDMATQTWVGQQGFATQTWVTSNFITIAYFDRLFRAYNNSTLVSHNDTTSTIDNIKAMFGFWTDFYLSALGTGGVSSVSISLSQLADVNVASPTGGQALVYDATNNKWVNGTIQTGVSSLSSLSDVLLSSLQHNQVLVYDSNAAKWVNTDLKTVNGYSLIGSGNISVSSGGVSGDYMWATQSGALNADICYDAGLYRIYNGSNLPSGAQYGALLGLPYRAAHGNSSPDFCGQIFIPNGDDLTKPDSLFYRTSENNFYHAWHEVVHTSGGQTIANNLRVADIKLEEGNEINSYRQNRRLHLNYRSVGDVTLCYGGGKVCIGYTDATEKLHIYNGNVLVDGNDNYYQVKSSSSSEQYAFGASINGYIYGSTYGRYLTFENGRTTVYNNLQIINMSQGEPYLLFNMYTVDWGNIRVKSNGEFYFYEGEGNTTPAVVNASWFFAYSQVTALSDARKKDVINNIFMTVEQVANAPAVRFTWKGERVREGIQVGTFAQYWQNALPEVVKEKEGELSMSYGVTALVSSIIIARKVVSHEERIKQLEKENKKLKERLNIA